MNEIIRIQDQLRKSFEGDAWHGTALWEILHDVTAAQASAQPLPNAHSIWEITLHISAWQNAVNERINGNPAVDPPGGDWPEITDTSEAAWQQTLADLKTSYETLLKTLATFPESRLDEAVADGFSTHYVTMHGLIQHNLYHGGQIALLKKALQ